MAMYNPPHPGEFIVEIYLIGRSPESWLAMQDHHDLWRACKKVNCKAWANSSQQQLDDDG